MKQQQTKRKLKIWDKTKQNKTNTKQQQQQRTKTMYYIAVLGFGSLPARDKKKIGNYRKN